MMKSKLGKACILALLVMQLVLATGIVAHAQGSYYTVQRGDTLYSIARRHGSSVQAIAQANGILNPARIYAGQVLLISTGVTWQPETPAGSYYIVNRGDTLSSIAWRFGTTHWAIAVANNLSNPNFIYPGQALVIPGYVATTTIVAVVEPTPTPTPTPTPAPQVADCSEWANITEPTVDAELDGSGFAFVRGTAAIDNFWYYKLEFSSNGEWPVKWSLIEDLHFEPVVNGFLDDWKTGALPEGVYQLRLTVVDKGGNYPEPCQVQVVIKR